MNIDELRHKINSLNLFENFPDIQGYSISLKEKNDVITDELCVQFYVKEKKSLNELKPEEILPSNLSAFDIEIITDVKQQGDAELLSSMSDEYNLSYPLTASLDNLYPDDNIRNLPNINRFKYRPLLGGISSVRIGSGDATLGMLVTDNTDDSVVALSNNHVYASSQFSGLCAFAGTFRNTLGLSARNPGYVLNNIYGNVYDGSDCIGTHKRCIAMKLGTSVLSESNTVDCAIVGLANYNLIHPLSTQIVGFKEKGPYKFASTAEINSLIDPSSPNYQAPIFRSGRTNGVLGYPGSLYTNRSSFSAINQPRRLPIQNIKSVRYTSALNFGTSVHNSLDLAVDYLKFKNLYGSDQGLIIETTNNEVFCSGYMNNVPKRPAIMSDMVSIGTFSYFNYSNTATFGISANTGQLVFYSFPDNVTQDTHTIPVGYNWNSSKNADGYILAPQQLPDYSNLKNIIISRHGNFILKDNSIYTIGTNNTNTTIGYETNPSIIPASSTGNTIASTWTKIPGNWLSIDEVALGEFVALSTSGELFYTAPPSCAYNKYNSFRIANNFTHSWNLTANKISNHKFKKLFSTGNWLSSMPASQFAYKCYPGLALSATGGKLVHIGLFGNNFQVWQAETSPLPNGGQWTESNIKVIENKNEISHNGVSKMVLDTASGFVYTMGYSVHPSQMSRYTSFFNSASSYSNTFPRPNFHKVDNVAVSDLAGWAYDTNLDVIKNRKEESIIYLSGGFWYCNGMNPMNIFPINDLSRDRIVVTSIAYSLLVGIGNGRAPLWYDCIRMISQNNDFRTSTSGDSGSAVFALLSANIPSLSAWKCIGLNFASNSTQNWAAVCRIDNVSNLLNIRPWDGTIPTSTSRVNHRTFGIPEPKRTYTDYLYISGRKYYNIGLP